MRTLVDLPEEDIRWLDRRAADEGKSRAALIREAVSAYRAQASRSGIEQAFGIWKGRADIGDSVEAQRRMRAEWTRPWDPDFDAASGEFPDLFDDEDDRERRRYAP